MSEFEQWWNTQNKVDERSKKEIAWSAWKQATSKKHEKILKALHELTYSFDSRQKMEEILKGIIDNE